MASNYPTSLDSFTDPTSGSSLASPSHSGQHIDLNDAVEKIEAKLGIGSSPASSAVNGAVLVANGSGTTTYSSFGQGVWTTWSPSWTSSGTAPAIGNGSISGRYCRIGNTVIGQIALSTGSTTTYGTGTWYFSLPLTNVNNVNAYATLGHGYVQDASAATVVLITGDRGNTSDRIHARYAAGSFGDVTATAPFTWASGDTLFLNFTYEYS